MADYLFGYLGRDGEVVLSPAYPRAEPFRGGVARVERPGSSKTHVIRRDGGDVGAWDKVRPCEEGMLAVAVQTGDELRWGFSDIDGHVQVPTRFVDVGAFRESVAPVRSGSVWGYVDRRGEISVPLRFSAAGPFCEGAAAVTIDGKAGHVDALGRVVGLLSYESSGPFSGGIARVVRGGREAYVSSGGEIVGPWWDQVRDPVDGFGVVRDAGRQAVVDASGRQRSEWFDEILWVNAGFYLAREPRGLRLYALDGRPAVDQTFERVYSAVDNLVAVFHRGKWGWINLETLVCVAPRWDDIGPIAEGQVAVEVGGKWGFADRHGVESVAPSWERVRGFSEGSAAVGRDGRWGFVDARGQVRVPVVHRQVDQFGAGVAPFRDVELERVAHGPRPELPQLHQVPALGLQHHWFEGVGPGEELGVSVVFDGELPSERRVRVEQLVAGWEASIEPQDPVRSTRADHTWVHARGLRVRLTNARSPRSELSTLVVSLLQLNLPIREILFGRWREGAPVSNPWYAQTIAYGSAIDRMRALWTGGAPASGEPDEVGPTTQVDAATGIVFEDRGFVPEFPDIVLYWGLTSLVPPTSEAASRAVDVETSLEAALLRRFLLALAPAPGIRGGRVSAGEGFGRLGYRFAVDADALRHTLTDRVFRYREAEVLGAIAEVVRELGLAPFIGWRRAIQRVQGAPRVSIYEFELWEHAPWDWTFPEAAEDGFAAMPDAPPRPVSIPTPLDARPAVSEVRPPTPTVAPAPTRAERLAEALDADEDEPTMMLVKPKVGEKRNLRADPDPDAEDTGDWFND
jgi:hypothetical protein